MTDLHFRPRHSFDFVFILLLLAVFCGGTFILVSIGAKHYENSVDSLNRNYQNRIYAAYLTEKITQNDQAGGIHCIVLDGTPVLSFTEQIDHKRFSTYIYAYDGYLREITTNTGRDFALADGQCIIAAKSLSVTAKTASLFYITVTAMDGKSESFYAAAESAQ